MYRPRAEPTLEEALSDDLVQAMMKADHVDPAWLRALLASVARKRRLDRPTVTGGSSRRFQGVAWLPCRRPRPLGQAARLRC
jgi:hypothetical protein